MKTRKIIFLILMKVMIFSRVQVNPIRAQDEPVVSTFGLDILNPSNTVIVDGDLGEPDNHWLHYNALRWSEVQPTQSGGLNWSSEHVQELDVILEEMNHAGMELILTIRSTPEWAQLHEGSSCGPMEADYFDDFAFFVAETVKRYSQEPYNLNYYEIWNEPDSPYKYFEAYKDSWYGCWGDPGDEGDLEEFFGGDYYGKMLKVVYPALKNASEDAQLVLGGLILPSDPVEHPDWMWRDDYWPYSNMSKFFEGILQTEKGEGWPYFDVVNFHSYTTYKRPFGETSAILMQKLAYFWRERGGLVEGKLDYIQGLMSQYGVDKPIFISEAALVDSNQEAEDYDPTYESAKEDYLVYVFTKNIALGIDATIWHRLDYYGWLQSGLLDKNNEPLPTYEVFHVMTKTLGGTVYNSELNLGEGILGFEFMKGSLWTWVVFSEDGLPKTINKPPGFSHAYNLLKNEVEQTETTISFDRPIYIDNYPNQPPYLPADVTDTMNEDELYCHEVSVTDDDFGDAHTLTATSKPDWLTLEKKASQTWTLSGTPRNDDVGVINFDLKVTDSGGLTDTQNFKITVLNVNDPPEFTSTPRTLVNPGKLYTYNIKATDDDLIHGDSLKITGTTPGWLSLDDKGGGSAVLSGTPGDTHIGIHAVSLTATDNAGAKATQDFVILIISLEDMKFIYLPFILQ